MPIQCPMESSSTCCDMLPFSIICSNFFQVQGAKQECIFKFKADTNHMLEVLKAQ